jgi:hypothetical protein
MWWLFCLQLLHHTLILALCPAWVPMDCCASLPVAGTFVQHSFTIRSCGNVALRGLAVQAPSLSGLTCTPPLAVGLAVNSATTCQGVHVVTQDEVETGVSQLSAVVNTVNLVPSGSSYSKPFPLAQVDPVTASSFSLAFEPTCASPARARKHMTCWLASALPCLCAEACIHPDMLQCILALSCCKNTHEAPTTMKHQTTHRTNTLLVLSSYLPSRLGVMQRGAGEQRHPAAAWCEPGCC